MFVLKYWTSLKFYNCQLRPFSKEIIRTYWLLAHLRPQDKIEDNLAMPSLVQKGQSQEEIRSTISTQFNTVDLGFISFPAVSHKKACGLCSSISWLVQTGAGHWHIQIPVGTPMHGSLSCLLPVVDAHLASPANRLCTPSGEAKEGKRFQTHGLWGEECWRWQKKKHPDGSFSLPWDYMHRIRS